MSPIRLSVPPESLSAIDAKRVVDQFSPLDTEALNPGAVSAGIQQALYPVDSPLKRFPPRCSPNCCKES